MRLGTSRQTRSWRPRHSGPAARGWPLLFAAYDGASALELVAQIPDTSLLVTNTRLGIVHGPELIRRTRELRPGMAILHVIHQDGLAPELIPDVLNLQEPFTPEELLVVVRALLH
jgi:hypothetical protein